MIRDLFFYVVLPIVAIMPIINMFQLSKLSSIAEKEDKICKCGSVMVKSYHPQYTYTRSAKCLSCNRTVDYACNYQLYTPIKSWKQELWTEPKKNLTCEKCGGEFFSNKYLGKDETKWIKCIQCGQEKDLRE